MAEQYARKVYVDVLAVWRVDGTILPRVVRWEDGTRYKVDKVLDVRPAASLKAGGCGIRYTVRILGKPSYIWLEENKWFVEAKH